LMRRARWAIMAGRFSALRAELLAGAGAAS